MKTTLTAMFFAVCLSFSGVTFAEPSGAIGVMTDEIGLLYGTVAVPGERVQFNAETSASVFCGIATLAQPTNLLWVGDSSELPVSIDVNSHQVWTLGCITYSGIEIGMLFSSRVMPTPTISASSAASDDSVDEAMVDALILGLPRL